MAYGAQGLSYSAVGLTLALCACANGGAGITGITAPGTTAMALSGGVRSGAQPLSGSTITVYAAGHAGEPATPLTQTVSDGAGQFAVALPCPGPGATAASTVIYVTAAGGHQATTGATNNAAIRLLSTLTACGGASSTVTVTVNELTTVASAFALNAFIAEGGISGSVPGLPNAVATAALLTDPSSGEPAAFLPRAQSCSGSALASNCATLRTLNALANALAACTVSASSDSSACVSLMNCATPLAADDGSGQCAILSGTIAPTDTLQAILSIARNPGVVSASGVFGVSAGSKAYAPVLADAPNDWSLSVSHGGGGISEPTALAIDAKGNVWIANYNNAVAELDPTGIALSPAGGYTGGGLEESFGIAIDTAGHVWVSNEQSGAFNSGLGSITELAADGSILCGTEGYASGGLDFPVAVQVDPAGHIWAVNYGNSTLTELASDGTALSPESGFAGGGLSFPVGLALDESGNLWIADQGANQISAFRPEGTPQSPPGGYTGGGLSVPQAIAIDQNNNLWVSNYYGGSITEFSAQGAPLSPTQGYDAGGLATPGGIAIDGAGQVWAANYETASVSELAGARAAAPGAALSPASGYTAASLLQPFTVAIDPSGNLWVSNFGNDSVTEFIGIAAPVATPMIGIPHSP